MRQIGFLLAALVFLGASGEAVAQSQQCRYEGREYQEGTAVCQAGLRQTCMNGSWQSLDGARCDGEDGEATEDSGEPRVLPQGGFGTD